MTMAEYERTTGFLIQVLPRRSPVLTHAPQKERGRIGAEAAGTVMIDQLLGVKGAQRLWESRVGVKRNLQPRGQLASHQVDRGGDILLRVGDALSREESMSARAFCAIGLNIS